MKIKMLPIYFVRVTKDTSDTKEYENFVGHELVVEEHENFYYVLGVKGELHINTIIIKKEDCKILRVYQRKHVKDLR